MSDENPSSLIRRFGCLGCHSFYGRGNWALVGGQGPPLDRGKLVARIQERLNSEKYLQSLKEIDSLNEKPYSSFKKARQTVVQATGLDKVRTWMKYHLMEPKFDNPDSRMPNFGFAEREALLITDYLLAGEHESAEFKSKIRDLLLLPDPIRYSHLLYFFIAGFFLAFLLFALIGIPKLAKHKGKHNKKSL